jgi:hypothetical protein
MIDWDDIDDAMLFGGLILLAIVLLLFFVFSRPKIDACHEKGGVMMKIEGKHKCVDKAVLKELK